MKHLRSYGFVAEVTFKETAKLEFNVMIHCEINVKLVFHEIL